MATGVAKKVKRMKIESLRNRLKKMTDIRAEYLKHVEDAHVVLQKGNNKTGDEEWTVSLIPGADCNGKCMWIGEITEKGYVSRGLGGCFYTGCYDIQNVCFQPVVQNDRARNSAIHKADRPRYWKEIEEQVVSNDVHILRINVGGDVDFVDMCYINQMAGRQPQCVFQFFTKNDEALNAFIEANGDFHSNVVKLLSAWPGMELNNPYNIPESHLIWEDGYTTLPEYARHIAYCGGNCSECHLQHEGCPKLKRSETVEDKEYQVLFAH